MTMAFDSLHRLIDRLADLPPLRNVRRSRFERRFQRRMGHAFHGVFATFDAAAAAVPQVLPGSYDNPEAAAMYADRLQVDDHDHPALFWLYEAMANGARTVCDLGGSIGIKYYAFASRLPLGPGTTWHVVEVPAAVELGRRTALAQGVADQLRFGTDPAVAATCEVLFASGALQYLPRSLGELLADLPRLPRRVIVNTTPIHPTRSFFTLNNIGAACCPYRVSARTEFLASLSGLGYSLRDQWRNIGKRLDLPFEDGLSLDHYSGFCFDRTARGAS